MYRAGYRKLVCIQLLLGSASVIPNSSLAADARSDCSPMMFRVEKSIPVLALSKVATQATNGAGLADFSYFWMDDEDAIEGFAGGVLKGLLIARSTDLGGNAVGISVSASPAAKIDIEAVPGRAAFKMTPRQEDVNCETESRIVEVLKDGKVIVGRRVFGIVR